MAAEKGNTYAEKWTKETVMPLLERIEDLARSSDEGAPLYLGGALAEVHLYRDVWAYWKEKFESDEQVFRSIKKIEQLFEQKIYEGALKGDLVASVSIFGLKNNHSWKDQSQIDHTSGGKEIRNVNFNVRTKSDSNATPAEDLEDE